MLDEFKYPVAETFFSIQGEGAQSGIPMIFLRLAGCNVGRPYTAEQRRDQGLAVYQNECIIYDKRKFPCDTNYRLHERLTCEEILERFVDLNPKCKWVSITGGEPLIHNLVGLTAFLKRERFKLHLETSGTIPFDAEGFASLQDMFDWIVVSPKHPFVNGYADVADEIRILIDEGFSWGNLPEAVKSCPSKIWISPVNSKDAIDPVNANICTQLVEEHPEVRVSLQIHKILGVR